MLECVGFLFYVCACLFSKIIVTYFILLATMDVNG
jgi:hypothetical protein